MLQNKINDLDTANTKLALNKTELQNKINDLDTANTKLALK